MEAFEGHPGEGNKTTRCRAIQAAAPQLKRVIRSLGSIAHRYSLFYCRAHWHSGCVVRIAVADPCPSICQCAILLPCCHSAHYNLPCHAQLAGGTGKRRRGRQHGGLRCRTTTTVAQSAATADGCSSTSSNTAATALFAHTSSVRWAAGISRYPAGARASRVCSWSDVSAWPGKLHGWREAKHARAARRAAWIRIYLL